MPEFSTGRRVDPSNGWVRYEVFEEGVYWRTPSGRISRPKRLRALLTVTVTPPRTDLGRSRRAEVSWPSISDNRPELGYQVGTIIQRASLEAEQMNQEAGLGERAAV